MSVVGTLIVKVLSDTTGLERGLTGAEARMAQTSKTSQAMARGLDRAMSMAGVALAGAAVASIKMAADFEASMTKINTLVGVNEKQVAQWGEALLSLSGEVAVGPRELADALFVVSSAGQRGAEALQIVEQAAKASALGLGETKEISRAVTAAMNAYGEETLSASRATDILTAIVREGNVEASELAPTLGRVIGIAAQLGVSFEEVGANIATFTRLGVDSTEAVTALRGILNSMLAPTEGAAEALGAVGLSAAGLRKELREKGLQSVLAKLITTFEGNEAALAEVIPNVRALAGVLGTAGRQGEAYESILRSIQSTTPLVNEEFKKLKNTSQYQFKELSANAEKLAITLGTKLAPALNSLVSGWNDLLTGRAGLFDPWLRALGLMKDKTDAATASTHLWTEALSVFSVDTINSSGALTQLGLNFKAIPPAIKNVVTPLGDLEKAQKKAAAEAKRMAEALEDSWQAAGSAVDNLRPLAELTAEQEAHYNKAAAAIRQEEEELVDLVYGFDKASLALKQLTPEQQALVAAAEAAAKALRDEGKSAEDFANDLGEGLFIAADFVKDFAGTAQQLLATQGGPWGMALAGGIELLQAFGVDVNKHLSDILSGLGIGGFGQRSIEGTVFFAVKDAFEQIGNQALILGEDFNRAEAEIRILEDALIEMLNQGVLPSHPAYIMLREALDIAREGAILASEALTHLGDVAGGGIIKDPLRWKPPFGVPEWVNDPWLTGEGWADLADIIDESMDPVMDPPRDAPIGIGGTYVSAINEILSAIDEQIRREQLLAMARGEAFDESARRTELLNAALQQYILHGDASAEVIVQLIAAIEALGVAAAEAEKEILTIGGVYSDVFGVLAGIADQVDQMRMTAEALGEPFNAMRAEADLLEQAIRKLIKDGFAPGNPILDELIARYKELNKEHRTYAGFLEKLTDKTLSDFSQKLDELERVLELTKDSVDFYADAIRAAEAAQRALEQAVADGTLSVEEAQAAWLFLQKQIDAFREAAREPVPPPTPGGGGGGVTVETPGGGAVVVRLPDVWEAGPNTIGVLADIRDASRAQIAATLYSLGGDFTNELRAFLGAISGIGFEDPFGRIIAPPPGGGGNGPSVMRGGGTQTLRLVDHNFDEILTGTLSGVM